MPFTPEQARAELRRRAALKSTPLFRGAGATGTWDKEGLPTRFAKGLYNIIPETIRGTLKTATRFSPGHVEMMQQAEEKILAGELGTEEAERMRKRLESRERESKRLAPVPITPATTVGEKATDIAAGVTGFVTKLALLKKAYPNIGGAALWEMENLSSGGTPGVGAATYTAFNLPGKVIKGVTVAARGGRVAAEAGLLGGMSAAHQKIETGEINASEVLIAAGIPIGLRAVGGAKGVLKRALKAKNPKAIRAVNEVITKRIPVSKKVSVPKSIEDFSEALSKGTIKPSGRAKSLGIQDQWDYFSKLSPKGQLNKIKSATELSVSAAKKAPERPLKARTPVEGVQTTNKSLLDWSDTAKRLRKTEVKTAISKLRRMQASRGTEAAAEAIKAGESYKVAGRRAKAAQKGKALVPEVTPPDLTKAQWEGLSKRIYELYPVKDVKLHFQRMSTQTALDKLAAGRIPTNYDFGFLDKLLGREVTEQLHANLAKHRTYGIWDVPVLTRDMLKSMFGWDPQVWRQFAGVGQRHPAVYAEAAKVNVQAYASKAHARNINKAIESSPNYKLGKDFYKVNYLGTMPWSTVKAGTRLQQYGVWTDFLLTRKNRVLKAWGRGLAASERGANAGMNTGLNGLVGAAERDLSLLQSRRVAKSKAPLSGKQLERWGIQRGRDINAFTKRVVAKNPKAKELQRAAQWILFSSAHTVSRPIAAWRSVANLVTGKGLAGRTYAAQVTASNIAKISLLSSIGSYVGHKWRAENPTEEPKIDSSINPLNSMWGKYRVGNDTIDLTGGDNSTYRLLARIGVSSYLYGQKVLTGKEQTVAWDWKVKSPGEEIKRYFNSRETVLLGLGKTLATGKDWVGNPIGRKEAILKQFPMEFLVSVIEAGNADGMWEALSQGNISEASKDFVRNLPIGLAGLAGAGTATYPVKAATTRRNFRKIIAEKEYDKSWDDLSRLEQRRLTVKHRKAFDMFERKIKEERIEQPYSFVQIQEEQHKSGIKITKLLSKSNREKVEGVSVAVSRRPKNFYLNDERYQKYQELVAIHLNSRLSKLNLKNKSDAVKIKMLESAIRVAKNKAYMDIRK